MGTKTPRFDYWKPTLDGDEGKWGEYLNENWDKLDSLLMEKPLEDSLTYGRTNIGVSQSWTRVYTKEEVDGIVSGIPSLLFAEYVFDDSTSVPPVATYATLNNADATLATLLRLSSLTSEGKNADGAIKTLGPGDRIRMMDRVTDETYIFVVSTIPTKVVVPAGDNYWDIPVAWQESTTSLVPADDAPIQVNLLTRASDHTSLFGRDEPNQHPATAVDYDNTASGYVSDEVQAMLDEVATHIDAIEAGKPLPNSSFPVVKLKTGLPNPSYEEGLLFYDDDNKGVGFYNDEVDITQTLGQEFFIRVYNDSIAFIPDGTPLSVGGLTAEGVPKVHPTDCKLKQDALSYLGLCTHLIPANSYGFITMLGFVRDIDTSGLTQGAPVFCSPTAPGALTSTEPESPFWKVRVGGTALSDASTGLIFARSIIYDNTEDTRRFFNGSILEDTDLTVTSADGVNVKCKLERKDDPLLQISLLFHEEYYTSPAPHEVWLTVGTDAVPQRNYVYFPYSTMVLTANTTGFPNTEQYVPVCEVMCQSASGLQTDGAYKVHKWTDHVSNGTGQGHLSHINKWIRNRPAAWISGCVQTESGVQGTLYPSIDYSIGTGVIFQLHQHTMPALTTAGDQDPLFVVNDPVTAYNRIPDLNATDLTVDALGGSLNNKVFSLVIWGVISELDQDCQLMVNLPSGTYNTDSAGIADSGGTTTYTIPSEYLGTGFLLSRLVCKIQGGQIKILEGGAFDLRGLIPAASGGVIGGAGIQNFTELLDTPSTYGTEYNHLVKVNNAGDALEFAEVVVTDEVAGVIRMQLGSGEKAGPEVSQSTYFKTWYNNDSLFTYDQVAGSMSWTADGTEVMYAGDLAGSPHFSAAGIISAGLSGGFPRFTASSIIDVYQTTGANSTIMQVGDPTKQMGLQELTATTRRLNLATGARVSVDDTANSLSLEISSTPKVVVDNIWGLTVKSDLQVDKEAFFLNTQLTDPWQFGFGKIDADTPSFLFSGSGAINYDRLTNQMQIVVGAAAAATITSTRWGIGTSSPQARFDIRALSEAESLYVARTDTQGIKMWGATDGNFIVGSGATAKRLIFDERSGTGYLWRVNGVDAMRLIDQNAGELGLGTNAPQRKLHVTSAENEIARFQNTSSTWGILEVTSTSGTVQFTNKAGNISLRVASNDVMQIFSGAPGDSARIDATGKFGINNTAPQAQLHVSRSDLASGNVEVARFHNSNAATAGYCRLMISDTSSTVPIWDDAVAIESSSGMQLTLSAYQDDVIIASGNRVERAVFKSDGKIGIGTPTPIAVSGGMDVGLHAGIGWTPSTATRLLVGRWADCALTIAAGNGASSFIYFGDNDLESVGSIEYDHATNYMRFATNLGERLRITSLGNIVKGGSSGPLWASGTGSPEGVVTAPIGSYYSRTDGGTGTSFYVKESGTGSTGWVAK